MFSFGVLLLLISPLFPCFFSLLYLDFMIPFGVFVLFPPANGSGWCASPVLCYFPLAELDACVRKRKKRFSFIIPVCLLVSLFFIYPECLRLEEKRLGSINMTLF